MRTKCTEQNVQDLLKWIDLSIVAITSGVFTVPSISFRLRRRKQLTLCPCLMPEHQLHGILAPLHGILSLLPWEQKAHQEDLLPGYLTAF